MASNVLTIEQSRVRTGMYGLALYCLGHFFIDLYSAAMGAFQPLFHDRLHFSLTQAGFLGGMMVFSGSFVQPAYGILSDRFHSRMFSVLAPAVAGIFISCLGLATNVWTAALLIFLGGAGVASFHPQASARATLGIETNRGRWMAVFISTGSLGLAFGPTYYTSITQTWGMERSWIGSIPGLIVTGMMLLWIREPAVPEHHRKFNFEPLRAVQGTLALLAVLVVLRSAIQMVFGQFLPLYLIKERGFTPIAAAGALSLFQAAGAFGGFMGGYSTDRFGGRRVIIWSMIGSVPFLCLFFFGSGVLSMIGLGLGGLILLFTVPVIVLMGQMLAPKAAGTVSALMMGFAWGFAGLIFVPLIGALSDRLSMQTTMSAMIVLPIIGFFLALRLPHTK
jgi:FSR family fosmidomycin resistance protein-like MFS transporter